LDEVAEVLERLEPNAQRRYFIDASADYDAQYTIWMYGSYPEQHGRCPCGSLFPLRGGVKGPSLMRMGCASVSSSR
jgi:hypothetical protein